MKRYRVYAMVEGYGHEQPVGVVWEETREKAYEEAKSRYNNVLYLSTYSLVDQMQANFKKIKEALITQKKE